MPWWVWLVLALFMLAMLVAGAAYALVHGMHAMKQVSTTGEKVNARVSKMSQRYDEDDQPQRAIFTEPLQVAADRYADAHAEVIERRERRQDRYATIWRRWSQFND
ncbi:MAG: hypothetical protein UHD09_06825 [Bifidobacterium sp.]|nr:hypothetical protein [Bifidobacterium sp.]